MFRQPSRRTLAVVRALRASATGVVVGVALVLSLGGATASPAGPDGSTGIDRPSPDARCVGAAGKAIVRTDDGLVRTVPFEHAWRVHRGERPGTVLAACSSARP